MLNSCFGLQGDCNLPGSCYAVSRTRILVFWVVARVLLCSGLGILCF